jgi:hypothetical protein
MFYIYELNLWDWIYNNVKKKYIIIAQVQKLQYLQMSIKSEDLCKIAEKAFKK